MTWTWTWTWPTNSRKNHYDVVAVPTSIVSYDDSSSAGDDDFGYGRVSSSAVAVSGWHGHRDVSHHLCVFGATSMRRDVHEQMPRSVIL